MSSKILRWIKDLPNTVKATIGLLSTIIPFFILLRADFKLAVVVLSGVIIVAALSYLAYIALARSKPAVGFSTKGANGYKYLRYRGWAPAGLVIMVLVCGLLFILQPTRQYILAALKGTKVAPRADVLIVELDSKHASKKFEIPNRLRADLEKELQRHNLGGVKVETFSSPVTSLQEAKEAAEQSGSRVVVWGWYDDLGATINLYTPEPQPPGEEALRLEEVSWTQGENALDDTSLKIREQLPDNITFLSLFIIGNLHYLNNEYQMGHRAFDAAMLNLPKESRFENESLLHFFSARSLAAAGPQNAESAICGYVKAIELNPRFTAAYNNLGILMAEFDSASVGQPSNSREEPPDSVLPKGIQVCLEKISADSQYLGFFFDEALKFQPHSAVIQYNQMASRWRTGLSEDSSDDMEVLRALEEILRRDPSIPGAHIMRGVLAFKDEDKDFDDWQTEVALRGFSNASRLLPNSAESHVNVGKVYVRKGRYTDARAEFEKALAIAPRNVEAHLAVADVAIRQGQPEVAIQHLNAVNADGSEDVSAQRVAEVLKARVYFDSGDMAAAVKTLRAHLSQYPEPTKAEADVAEEAIWLMDNDTSLIHYLLGLLYTSASDAGSAGSQWDKCDIPEPDPDTADDPWWWWQDSRRKEAHNNNDTAVVSWLDILALCQSETPNPSKWGIAGTCLPQDMHQRLTKVFDIAQARVANRIFYRARRLPLEGAACPYVYTFDAVQGRWLFDTTIIHRLDRKELETTQSRTLKRFNGRVIVREVEPEISYLDYLAVVVIDRLGRSHVLRPHIQTLRDADSKYLILRPGDEIHLTFKGFEHIEEPERFRIEAKGYYVPLR